MVPNRRAAVLRRGDLARYGAALAAGSLLAGEESGLALDFTSDTAVIRWPAQPASQYQGRLAKGLLTYTAPSPKMVYGPTGVLRFQNHNLCPYSETLADAGWSKNNLSIGAANAIVEDTASTSKQVARGSIAVSAGLTYLCNVYVKIGAQGFLRIGLDSGTFGASGSTWYNLGTGAVGTNQGSTTPSITPVPELGAGVYKCSYLRAATATGNTTIYIAPAATDGGTTYLGTGATALTILGVELKRAPVHEDTGWAGYVPTGATGAALVPLDYDPGSLSLRGALIEEQRTNLLSYSEALGDASWTKLDVTIGSNLAPAPDGAATMDKIVPSTSYRQHILRKTATISAGAYAAGSGFFAPAGYDLVAVRVLDQAATGNGFYLAVNLSTGTSHSVTTGEGTITDILIERQKSGGYRVGIAGRTKSTTTTVIVDYFVFGGSDPAGSNYMTGDGTSGIYAWGLQGEQGASVGSYIPTGAAQVTRAADIIRIGTSAVPYSAAEGTVIGEGGPRHAPAGDTPMLASIDDGTSANRIQLRRGTSGDAQGVVVTGGAVQANCVVAGAWSTGGARRVAVAWRQGDVAVACNGAASAPAAAAGIPAVSDLRVGNAAGAAQLNGHVRRLAYIPRRLTDAELQRRTA